MRAWIAALIGGAAVCAVGLFTLAGIYAWFETDLAFAWIVYQASPFLIPAIATASRLLDAWAVIATTGAAILATGSLHWWIFNDGSSTTVIVLIFVPVVVAIPVFVVVAHAAEATLADRDS